MSNICLHDKNIKSDIAVSSMFNFYLQVDDDRFNSYVIPSAAMDKPISFTAIVLTSSQTRDPKYLWTWQDGRIVSLFTNDCITIEDDNVVMKQINFDERMKEFQQWKILKDGKICSLDNSKYLAVSVDDYKNFDNCPLELLKFYDNEETNESTYYTWKIVTHHPDFTTQTKQNR